jgi:hypothetical protein
MSTRSESQCAPIPLFSSEGQLVFVSVSVEPRYLEDLLDTLAQLDFPVNPQLYHKLGFVEVEFPAYAGHSDQVKKALERAGFDGRALQISSVLPCTNRAGSGS